MPWATDLRHIGLALREHERLMSHWKRVLDLRWLDVRKVERKIDQRIEALLAGESPESLKLGRELSG